MRWLSTLTLVLLAGSAAGEDAWDRKAAAGYLDARAEVWVTRSRARQKLTTACISCHTAMPYLLSRASLGSGAKPAQDLIADVETRVRNWGDVKVWYDTTRGEEKPAQSWGTESVMNAFVLTSRDLRSEGSLTEDAKTALENMWAQQTDKGNWPWLHFGLGPWEADGSNYWGTSLAAVAAMSVAREVKPPAEASAKLRTYLRSGLSRELNAHNQLALLWAASTWDELLSEKETQQLVAAVSEHQRADGGFRLPDLAPWPTQDGTAQSNVSDGYATAFTTFVLQQVDAPSATTAVARGVAWLEQHQQADGSWETVSLNMDRSEHDAFRRLLMSDAATAYAVLVLTSTTDAPSASEP